MTGVTTDSLIESLYANSLTVPATEYRDWALQHLRAWVSFDAAQWRRINMAAQRVFGVSYSGLPPSFSSAFDRVRHVAPVYQKLDRGDAAVVTSAEFDGLEFNPAWARLYSAHEIQQSAGVFVHAAGGVLHEFMFFRADAGSAFSAEQAEALQRACRHMVAAASHAYFLLRGELSAPYARRPAALIDARGLFYEAQPAFIDLLQSVEPDFDGVALPFAIEHNQYDRVFSWKGLSAYAQAIDDLTVLRLWEGDLLAALTQREREVIRLVCEGHTQKSIAVQLDISASTVATHIYAAYSKLGVTTKTELLKLLSPN
jgi:DNA-binding CsgD family transcriptional regulator